MRLVFVTLLFLTAIIFSCSKDKVTENPISWDCDTIVSFSNEVVPIFDQNCSTSGCHDASSASAGYVFDSYESISASAEISVDVMLHRTGLTPMPFTEEKLADSVIQVVGCWIDQGKQNN